MTASGTLPAFRAKGVLSRSFACMYTRLQEPMFTPTRGPEGPLTTVWVHRRHCPRILRQATLGLRTTDFRQQSGSSAEVGEIEPLRVEPLTPGQLR